MVYPVQAVRGKLYPKIPERMAPLKAFRMCYEASGKLIICAHSCITP
jgi:hypothetical protein